MVYAITLTLILLCIAIAVRLMVKGPPGDGDA